MMKDINRLTDFNYTNKKILIRVDFNLPLDKNQNVLDDYRIIKAIPTINYILDQKPKQIILMSHLGKPKGEYNKDLSLTHIQEIVEKHLKNKIRIINNFTKDDIPKDKILMLENLRFFPEEKKDDLNFAKKLSKLADIYVNDAFGTSHRKHTSVHKITKFLPSCAGLLLESEIKNLTLKKIERPFVTILGAAKIADKIELINILLKKVDYLLLGGAIVFNFLKAKDYEIGKSLYEPDHVDTAKELLKNKKIILPNDIVISDSLKPNTRIKTVRDNEIPENSYGLDIGKDSVERFKKILRSAKTIFWNGPMGKFEQPPYDKATKDLAKFISNLNATTIIGGGDTVNAIRKFGLEKRMTHVSTGGGASIEMIEGKKLPAIQALKENKLKF